MLKHYANLGIKQSIWDLDLVICILYLEFACVKISPGLGENWERQVLY